MKEDDPWAGGLDSLNTLYTWLPLWHLLQGERRRNPEWLWGGW